MEYTIRHYFISNSEPAECHKVGILLENEKDRILDLQGQTLLLQGPAIAIALDGCENVTIQNGVIDWEIPMSAEGTVTAASPCSVTVAIDREKYPHHVENGKLVFTGNGWSSDCFGALEFDIDGFVRPGAGDTFPRVTVRQAGDCVELLGNFTVVPRVGNTLVLRHGKRIHPGLFCQNSKNVTLKDLTFHATCGLGALFQFCENITVQNVSFVPGPGRKVISGHDDGLHFSNCRGHILVENCRFRGLMDDPINVHGTSTKILSVDGNTIRGCFGHPQSVGFDRWALPGDVISFLNCRTLDSVGVETVADFDLLSPTEFTVRFSGPVPKGIRPGDALENLTNTPSLVCRKNFFGSCRARGLLVTTPKKVLIEDNVFESSGSAILLCGDANSWYESGACKDVTIRRNRFHNCLTSRYQFCEGVISICPEIPNREHSRGFHENITITENTFDCPGARLLYEHCTNNLIFENNEIAPASF